MIEPSAPFEPAERLPHRDILAIGASAGGLAALSYVLAESDVLARAAVLVVLHLSPTAESQLPVILQRDSALPVRWARSGLALRPGVISLAPPDRHLIVEHGRLSVLQGPREHHARPSINRLFRSLAVELGGRTVGLLLTGTLDDGVEGLVALRRCGGLVAVQDPDDAAYPEMPRAALAALAPDALLSLATAGRVLGELLARPVQSVVVPAEIAARNTADCRDRGSDAPSDPRGL